MERTEFHLLVNDLRGRVFETIAEVVAERGITFDPVLYEQDRSVDLDDALIEALIFGADVYIEEQRRAA